MYFSSDEILDITFLFHTIQNKLYSTLLCTIICETSNERKNTEISKFFLHNNSLWNF